MSTTSPWFMTCALCMMLAISAQAQTSRTTANIPESAYRPGQAEVITPGSGFDFAVFQVAYAQAGKPVIAVLWNREFSDQLEQSSSKQIDIRSSADHEEYLYGDRYGIYDKATKNQSATITETEGKTKESLRYGPAERIDKQMRAAFLQTLRSGGVRLADRNLLMRSAAAQRQNKGDSVDSQQIETEALLKHAQLLIEVLHARDRDASTGWATHVAIKHLRDGVLLDEYYSDGQEDIAGLSAAVPRFAARSADVGGGFRQLPPTVSDIGKRLAEITLMRLESALPQ